MLQSMWFWAASGLVGVLVVSVVPGVGAFVLAPLAAVVIGVMAAWYAPDGSVSTEARVDGKPIHTERSLSGSHRTSVWCTRRHRRVASSSHWQFVMRVRLRPD